MNRSWQRIQESDELVKKIYQSDERARLVSTIPGFGKFLSVLVVTEIADIDRFPSVGKLHCYAGGIPFSDHLLLVLPALLRA